MLTIWVTEGMGRILRILLIEMMDGSFFFMLDLDYAFAIRGLLD